MHSILHKKNYNIGKSEKYLVPMWSQTKYSGIKLPEHLGVSMNLDPKIQLEKQRFRPFKGNEILTREAKDRSGKTRHEEKETSSN